MAGAIGAAYERDAGHAKTLLTTLTTDAGRDAALRGLAIAMRRTSSSGAATRALEIKDTAVQHKVLEGIVVPWLKADPENSRKWLETTPTVPAAWKQQWLQRP